jgi:hypothetical protein
VSPTRRRLSRPFCNPVTGLIFPRNEGELAQ